MVIGPLTKNEVEQLHNFNRFNVRTDAQLQQSFFPPYRRTITNLAYRLKKKLSKWPIKHTRADMQA